MRVAYVHDWLVTYRGGEKVLEALLELYPKAPIYTLFYDPKKMPASINSRDIRTPNNLNYFKKIRKGLLPLLPSLIESLPLENYDLIISSSSCVAKGVMVGPKTKHICYIHSPMRYIWDQRDAYFGSLKSYSLLAPFIQLFSSKLRLWDSSSSNRVDRFIANSSFVGQRVSKYYRRESGVIYPPVAVDCFLPPKSQKKSTREPYFLVAGAFVFYKRFDLAIKACEALGKKLIVAGSGPEEAALRKIAGKNTQFLIAPKSQEWIELFRNAEAFLFPALEDFGITAIEAMASGTPVIAYKGGGALDYIEPGMNGEFFEEQTTESLSEVLENFQSSHYDQDKLVSYAKDFKQDCFIRKMQSEIENLLKE